MESVKRLAETVLFILICLICALHLSYLFRNTGWSRYNITSFYEEPEYTLDVILIGGSNVFRYFNPLQAYAQEGFTSYDYAVEFGAPLLSDAIKDVKRTQRPELIIVDPRYFISSFWSNAMSTGCKNQLGSQDFHTLDRAEAAAKYKLLGKNDLYEAMSVFLDLPVYHDNTNALSDRAHWLFCDDNRGDAGLSSYGSAKGYVLYHSTYEHSAYSNDITSELLQNCISGVPLKSSAEGLYRDFLSYCVEHDINLLLVEAPYVFTEQDILESNTLKAIAAEYNIPFLDISFILENTGIDYETDFSDANHVNILGAEKYTTFLSGYLNDNYDLPDHRADSTFSYWNSSWDKFKEEQEPLIAQLSKGIT